MPRLVNAAEAAERVSEKHGIPLSELVDTFCDISTVDAVPAVHGRWIPTYHTYYNRAGEYQIADEWHCSNCGIYSNDEWHYCHNCGAHMDQEVTGDAYRPQQ